jgi:hypothetical protein
MSQKERTIVGTGPCVLIHGPVYAANLKVISVGVTEIGWVTFMHEPRISNGTVFNDSGKMFSKKCR